MRFQVVRIGEESMVAVMDRHGLRPACPVWRNGVVIDTMCYGSPKFVESK